MNDVSGVSGFHSSGLKLQYRYFWLHSFGGYFMWAPGTYLSDRGEGDAVHANIGVEKYFFAAGDREGATKRAQQIASAHGGSVASLVDELSAHSPLALALAFALRWLLRRTRIGLVLRTVGESAEAARALGYDVNRVRLFATMAGGFLAGVGGSFLSLYYPGSWNEGLSSGQGLMAVALVIFARWDPIRAIFAASFRSLAR